MDCLSSVIFPPRKRSLALCRKGDADARRSDDEGKDTGFSWLLSQGCAVLCERVRLAIFSHCSICS